MIKSRIVTIEGLDYEIENDSGHWRIVLPDGLGLLETLDLHPYQMKHGEITRADFTYEDALRILHSVLRQIPRARPVKLHELSAKERVTLDRCCALVSRVVEVPEARVVMFLSPDPLSAYCRGCKDFRCECDNKAFVAVARRALQSFETTLKAVVHGCALHKQPFDDGSDEHMKEIDTLYARLVLQLAQGES